MKVQSRCRKPNFGHPARSKTLNTMKSNSRPQTTPHSDADMQQVSSLWTNSSSVQKRLKPHLTARGKTELMCVSLYFSPHNCKEISRNIMTLHVFQVFNFPQYNFIHTHRYIYIYIYIHTHTHTHTHTHIHTYSI